MAIKKAAPKKKVAAKAAPKKAAVKKAAPKAAKAAVAKAPAVAKKVTAAISAKMSKSQIYTEVATTTGLNRKQVASVLEELESLIARSVGKKGVGEFTVPGLLKITTVKKPATKARKGVSPFTGEEITFKAKPARTIIKVRPLKKLKTFAEA
ncbi:MAG: HU family DNA-binding protein [Spongiibacteraceae bacterium]